MSPLDAARSLQAEDLSTLTRSGTVVCAVCHHAPHESDCPVLALPSIVRVLEAAEDMRRLVNYDSEEHFMSAALARFDAAMKGEEVPA